MTGFVRTLDEEDIPITLTDEHSACHFGQPVVLLDGTPRSPLDLVYALRPAARTDPDPRVAESYAVLVAVMGTGEPIYYRYGDTFAVSALLSGGYDNIPYNAPIDAAALIAKGWDPEMVRALAEPLDGGPFGPPPLPDAVPADIALADPAEYIAYTPTADEWALVRAARHAGYLVHVSPTYLTSDEEYGRRHEPERFAGGAR